MALIEQYSEHTDSHLGYNVEGQLLEVCSCNIPCLCWGGEDAEGGACDGVLAWHYEKGTVNGVDVSGGTFVILTHIPDNVLKGTWRILAYIDDAATDEQRNALFDMWTGKLGGPVKDLARLVGEVLGVEQVPISFTIEGGQARLKIGDAMTAELESYRGASRKRPARHDPVITPISGAPAYRGKAGRHTADRPRYGFGIDLTDDNSGQGSFRFVA